MKEKSKIILDGVANDMRFLKGWLKKPRSVGSVKPTSRAAARLMVEQIPKDRGLPVLELGPGTGIITKTMIECGIAPRDIVSVEHDPVFYRHLQHIFPEVGFVHGDAFDLENTLAHCREQKFSAIVSGIPLLNFKRDKRQRLVLNALDWLEKDGPFIQLCYGPKPPVPASPGIYTAQPTKWIFANIPPARFWVYRRTALYQQAG